MPVGTYLLLMEIVEDKSIDEELRNVEVVSLLSGRSSDELMSIPFADYRMVANMCDFLNHQPKIQRPKKRYKLGDFDCCVELRPEKLTTAQYIDFKELASRASDQLVTFLSIFIVPRGKKYNEGYDMRELHEAIREYLPITEAQSIVAFFFDRLHYLIRNTLCYTAKAMKRERLKTSEGKRKKAEIMEEMKILTRLFENGGGHIKSMFLLALPIQVGRLYTLGAPASF